MEDVLGRLRLSLRNIAVVTLRNIAVQAFEAAVVNSPLPDLVRESSQALCQRTLSLW